MSTVGHGHGPPTPETDDLVGVDAQDHLRVGSFVSLIMRSQVWWNHVFAMVLCRQHK